MLVVDDEQGARLDLISMLRRIEPDVLIREADSKPAAQTALATEHFDAVFLDVDLGNASGFEVLQYLAPETPVVFVTAYAEYAVRAFEADAVDYLLKPVESARLEAALRRVGKHRPSVAVARPFSDDDWLFLAATLNPVFVQVKSICCIIAEGDYTAVHTGEQSRWLVKRSIREWSARLAASSFARIHRGTIVNLNFVTGLTPRSSGGYAVHIRGFTQPLLMSRSFAREIGSRLGL